MAKIFHRIWNYCYYDVLFSLLLVVVGKFVKLSADVLAICCFLFFMWLLNFLVPLSPLEDDVCKQANEHGCQGGAVDGDEVLIETAADEAG